MTDTSTLMLIPGPDHPMAIAPAPARMIAAHGGQVIADSTRAMVLREANYPPCYYFPREDVVMDRLTRTDRSTHCPYKGDASYFTLTTDALTAENGAWSYEKPYPSAIDVTEMISFYPNHVSVYPADVSADA